MSTNDDLAAQLRFRDEQAQHHFNRIAELMDEIDDLQGELATALQFIVERHLLYHYNTWREAACQRARAELLGEGQADTDNVTTASASPPYKPPPGSPPHMGGKERYPL